MRFFLVFVFALTTLAREYSLSNLLEDVIEEKLAQEDPVDWFFGGTKVSPFDFSQQHKSHKVDNSVNYGKGNNIGSNNNNMSSGHHFGHGNNFSGNVQGRRQLARLIEALRSN